MKTRDNQDLIRTSDLPAGLDYYNQSHQSNNNQQEATEAPEETEETEEKGSSPLPLILFGIVLVAIIGGIVFIFIIKPRLGSGDDNDDDDDDDDETV